MFANRIQICHQRPEPNALHVYHTECYAIFIVTCPSNSYIARNFRLSLQTQLENHYPQSRCIDQVYVFLSLTSIKRLELTVVSQELQKKMCVRYIIGLTARLVTKNYCYIANGSTSFCLYQ